MKELVPIFKKHMASRILHKLIDVNPMTYREEMKKSQEDFEEGLVVQPMSSPRFNYFDLLSKVNSKLTKNKF